MHYWECDGSPCVQLQVCYGAWCTAWCTNSFKTRHQLRWERFVPLNHDGYGRKSALKKTIVCPMVRQIFRFSNIGKIFRKKIDFFIKNCIILSNFKKLKSFSTIAEIMLFFKSDKFSVKIGTNLRGQTFPSIIHVWFWSYFSKKLANDSWCLQLHRPCVYDISRACCSSLYMVLVG